MWADGFAAYLDSYEVRLHTRKKTYGGVVWPTSHLIPPARQLEIAVAAIETRRTA